jgi:hypothetical protein
MTTITKTFIAIIAAVGITAVSSNEAKADGAHFRLGGLHVDVGNPHGSYAYRGYRSYNNYGGYRYQPYSRHYSGYRGGHGHAHWHDTSHYDYHPGGFQRHYDHYHYVPGHYDFHREGHWDHH